MPFGVNNSYPIDRLRASGIDFLINPLGRKLSEGELGDMISDYDILIAGTESITEQVMKRAKHLKFISRVGVGLDGVDLMAAYRLGIKVSYTPEAPAPAVSELTIASIMALLRSTYIANTQLHRGEWCRHFGRRITQVRIGLIGVGRIGMRVLKLLSGLGVTEVLVNDLDAKQIDIPGLKLEWVDKETIFRNADVISLHVPLTPKTKNIIKREQLLSMKRDALIINTARGGIINENDLADVLISGHLGGAAIDVFYNEPYSGPLSKIERCLLTAHMGSMSFDCRSSMEIEATEEAIRFINNQSLLGLVPQEEYFMQNQDE